MRFTRAFNRLFFTRDSFIPFIPWTYPLFTRKQKIQKSFIPGFIYPAGKIQIGYSASHTAMKSGINLAQHSTASTSFYP